MNAVAKLEKMKREELVELLMSLPKRERAMCLFNVEVLRAKIADAKMVLDVEDDEEEVPGNNEGGSSSSAPVVPTPVTPQARKVASYAQSPQTPDLSSRGPSATASPTPATPSGSSAAITFATLSPTPAPAASTTYTIASLAKLSATEIVRLASGNAGVAGLPVPKADPLVVRATDEFVDDLMGKPVQMQKQQLGDKLWRVVKAFGIKGAPKITIALLDQEDLRSLAHLMNSYPAVLKEKALLVQAAISK
ncbi:hypothetical protein NLI96_g6824 [Meripilus lineatus]|uniref:PABC domain-containing protein n=1 Tax=Meripilus lineatus TaxID=2056292 RepID=A0AAD5V220_9APHY|nr:hypothetical protein NLI96_g6824 [Physisporinus lineatus]